MSKNLKRNALGRGLSALLNDSESVSSPGEVVTVVNNINEIPVDSIETNPFQPRTVFDEDALNELADSIKVQGIIQPITVRRHNEQTYQLISGERRFQASKRAGLTAIPAYIRTADDQQMLEMALIENIQRENLNALEIAMSYQRLISECSLKQEELGDRVGKNRSTVTNYLRLLKLPPDIQAGLRDNRISMGHARALISIERVDDQLAVYKKVLEGELSVRKTEELVRQLENSKVKAPKEVVVSPLSKEIQQLQSKLTTHFGTKIVIKSDESTKGEIKIPFVSGEDLNRILEILNF